MIDEDEAEHCKDCCCARSWRALGVMEYTGKSIPEYIDDLKAERDDKLEVERQSIIVLSDMVVDKEAEIEHWKLNCLSKDDELAQLRAERDAYHQDRDNWRASCKQVENERDAAYVRGLKRAVEIARNHFKGYDIEWWRTLTKNEIYAAGNRDIADSIQAEIEKAGKP